MTERKTRLSIIRISFIAAAFFCFSLPTIATANRPAFSQADRAEFSARRDRLFKQIGNAIVVLIADDEHPHAVKFRQSPDFFYLTGIEEPGAILLLDGAKKETRVFTRKRPPGKVKFDGPGLLEVERASELYGINEVLPLESFAAVFGEAAKGAQKLYAQLTPPDTLQKNRSEIVYGDNSLAKNPLYRPVPLYKQAVEQLRALQPQLEAVNINPILDEMRWIKTAYEIERMRESGRIGAEGVKEVLRQTKPGIFEYELEAAAIFTYTKLGARNAFTPIVASGENGVVWHYIENSRRMKSGELVLMDTGADYDYYTSDITRTWAVDGRFTAEQEKMYRCVLEARNAVIAAMKPGVTVKQMQDIAEEVYKQHGYQKEYLALGRYIGHHVGISVHDVNPPGAPRALQAGVVYNVEPILEIPERKIHIRLEDTVLVTATGAENLTAGVPAEVKDVNALIRGKK